jgi:hypothetical protein
MIQADVLKNFELMVKHDFTLFLLTWSSCIFLIYLSSYEICPRIPLLFQQELFLHHTSYFLTRAPTLPSAFSTSPLSPPLPPFLTGAKASHRISSSSRLEEKINREECQECTDPGPCYQRCSTLSHRSEKVFIAIFIFMFTYLYLCLYICIYVYVFDLCLNIYIYVYIFVFMFFPQYWHLLCFLFLYLYISPF